VLRLRRLLGADCVDLLPDLRRSVRALISMPQPSQWGTPSRQHHTKAFFRTDCGNSIRLMPRRLLTSPAPF